VGGQEEEPSKDTSQMERAPAGIRKPGQAKNPSLMCLAVRGGHKETQKCGKCWESAALAECRWCPLRPIGMMLFLPRSSMLQRSRRGRIQSAPTALPSNALPNAVVHETVGAFSFSFVRHSKRLLPPPPLR